MALYDIPIHTLQGADAKLGDYAGKTLLLVNVASKCGLTPQYEGLERLQKTYGDRGFSVIGFPCNQFLGQEPGSAEEIEQFCSTTYGVTFPMFEKVEVNGPGRHAVYDELTAVPGSWPRNWLQGNPMTEKSRSAYFFWRRSSPSYCGVRPHLEATLTRRNVLPAYWPSEVSLPCRV